MAKLLEKPEELKVITNIEGIPLTITRNGKSERVTMIYQQLSASEQLWSQEIPQNCYRIRINKCVIYDICHDVISKSWYLNRIHDQ